MTTQHTPHDLAAAFDARTRYATRTRVDVVALQRGLPIDVVREWIGR